MSDNLGAAPYTAPPPPSLWERFAAWWRERTSQSGVIEPLWTPPCPPRGTGGGLSFVSPFTSRAVSVAPSPPPPKGPSFRPISVPE